MLTLLAGSAALSFFHALIPSHWLPILAISKHEHWTGSKTLRITLLIGMAHVLSTILLGFAIAAVGASLANEVAAFTKWFSPTMLFLLGAFYVYQHYYHHHFHLHKQESRWGIVASLAISMFFSPCLEIEGYFLAAGPYGWSFIFNIALVYAITSVVGMVIWMQLAYHGMQKLDWHAWEHYAGLVTGILMIASGVLMIVWE